MNSQLKHFCSLEERRSSLVCTEVMKRNRQCSEVITEGFSLVMWRSNDDRLHVKGVRVGKRGAVFVEGEGWRGGGGRGGGGGGGRRGAAGPSGREAAVGRTGGPGEVLLNGGGDGRLFVLLRRNK